MQEVKVFQDVYADLRFPLICVDIEKLREFLRKPQEKQTGSHFAASLRSVNGKKESSPDRESPRTSQQD